MCVCVCVCARARVRLCEYVCVCMRVCTRACARTFAHLVTHSRLLVVDGCSIRFFVIPSARAAPSTHTFTDPHPHVATVMARVNHVAVVAEVRGERGFGLHAVVCMGVFCL